VGDRWREFKSSPSFMSLRQGGDNISRKARIVASSIEDRKIKTVVDDANPYLLYRFDGERWLRWSVAWRDYEEAPLPPPLRSHLAVEGSEPAACDRFLLDAGTWRRLDETEPDGPASPGG
jgi:hypothetical protein